ncbi:MAG: AAA family ATPase [Eubacterium sp.]
MKNYVITIGRQFASGGREIGKMLAQRLDIDFYDAELLRKKAKEIGVEEGIFDLFDEKPTNSFLFSIVTNHYAIESAVNEGKVVEAQRKVITNAAQQGPCVIVGRRADKILAENSNVVSVFIAADMDDRIARYLENDSTNAKSAKRLIETKDKERASYYNCLGDGVWGRADNYTMCFSTSKMPKEQIVDIIADYINKTFSQE